MSGDRITPEQFQALLPAICDADTTFDSGSWKPANPLLGHCAVVSVLAHAFFGGDIIFAKLARGNTKSKTDTPRHYWNIMPDGSKKDFTIEQFMGKQQKILSTRRVTNSLQHIRIKRSKRYKLLAWRLAGIVNKNNPIFADSIYRKCFYSALDSSCQKMKFGCVITHNGTVVYEGYNKTIEPLKTICQPKCIRLSISSRTESMLGACGHAEEGLWKVIHEGIPINECELYIAGFYTNGIPWFKEAAEHTCLRCAVQMYNAHLKTIYVPVVDKWVGITPEKAVETALSYATREKAVEKRL